MTKEVKTENTVGLENGLVRMEFDRATGALVGLRNLATGDEYLKDPGGDGNIFRGYADTTQLPPAVTALFPFPVQPVEDAMGGRLVDPKDCKLVSSSFRRTKAGGVLTLVLAHSKPDLEFVLSVTLPADDVAVDCALTVRNTGKTPHTLMTAFPYLTGLGLGPDRETNFGVVCRTIGSAGGKAWIDIGGVYGNNISMQWDSVYEPNQDEGFGYLVMDADIRNKIMRRFPGGGMSTLYFTPEKLAPGSEVAYPPARLVVHEGDWRVVAKRYGEWFNDAFDPRPAPKWMDEADMYQGPWIPDPSEEFPSFRNLDRLYLNNYFDVLEWAMYWQGVTRKELEHRFGADGTYYFRQDLGGPSAMREGVDRVHKLGRRVFFYVAMISVREDSDLFKGTNIDDWKLLDRPDHMLDIDYPEGVSMCIGYKPWQDHVVQTCKRILWETGADGIRLDEFGTPFIPCFNPAHHHESPYDCNKWALELFRRVREAMDEVDPDALLWTENPMDFTLKYSSSALVMYCNNDDLELIRLATPSARMLSYVHPGSIDAALNGYAAGRSGACRRGRYYLHWALERDIPDGFPKDGGPVMRWHELRASFRDVFNHGQPHDRDPVAPDDPRWLGRLWMGDKYWLMVGGHPDATDLDGPTRIELPELPGKITQAYEFDAYDLTRRKAPLTRKDGKVYVTVKSSFSAVLLPKPNCPPMVEMKAGRAVLPVGWRLGPEARTKELDYNRPFGNIDGRLDAETAARQTARPGAKIKLSLKVFAPWRNTKRAKVRVKAYGLEQDVDAVQLPGVVTVTVPEDAEPGHYIVRVTGGCLELKRWVSVKE